ncbi:ComF family protein [Halomonas sp. AOP5-B2-8]
MFSKKSFLKQGLQRGSYWIKRNMPGYCAFCLAPTAQGLGWCDACADELPWNLYACSQCGEPVKHGQRLCGHCLTEPPAFLATQAGLLYQGVIKELIHDFKFNASPRAGVLLCELMLMTQPQLTGQAFVSVPMHPANARERGFNQSYWLAKQLSHRLAVPLHTAQRVKRSRSQRTLNRRERASNLADAFAFQMPPPEHLVIIDDVVTTGATGHAMACAALEAGAKRIDIWAVARTPLGKG